MGRLITIEEGGGNMYYKESLVNAAYGRGGDMSAPAAPVPTIEPGSQDIIINVTLRYEIN